MLSDKEREALLLWFQSMSKASVARRMRISEHTVKQYVDRARIKYARAGRPAATKAALLARAIEDGLVRPEEIGIYRSHAVTRSAIAVPRRSTDPRLTVMTQRAARSANMVTRFLTRRPSHDAPHRSSSSRTGSMTRTADDDSASPLLDRHRAVVLEPGEAGAVARAGQRRRLPDRPAAAVQAERRWTLPRCADVAVTDRRLAYVCDDWDLARVGGARHRSAASSPAPAPAPARARRRHPGRHRPDPLAVAVRLHLLPAPGPQGVLIVCDSMRSRPAPGADALAAGVGRRRPASSR